MASGYDLNASGATWFLNSTATIAWTEPIGSAGYQLYYADKIWKAGQWLDKDLELDEGL